MRKNILELSVLLAIMAAAVSGCTSAQTADGKTAADATRANKKVVLVTHESFPAADFAQAASAATGYQVEVVSAGDGGDLTNKLVLTKDAPIADVFFGVDSFFASRLVAADVVAPYKSPKQAVSADAFNFDNNHILTPIDDGAVCFNADTEYFMQHNLPLPQSYDDLLKPAYRGLTVAIDPAGSSTGIAFLAGTVAKYGEQGFAEYWGKLKANGARFAPSWETAYHSDFSQGAGKGPYPIVLSYAASPAWTLNADATASRTVALLETCTSTVEYAGVLQRAANPDGAKAVIDFLASQTFQNTIAHTMYMYPVNSQAQIPETWAKFAPAPHTRNDVELRKFGANRETWLRTIDRVLNG